MGESLEELYKALQGRYETLKVVRNARRNALLEEYQHECEKVAQLNKELEEMRINCRSLHITVETQQEDAVSQPAAMSTNTEIKM